MNKVNHIVRILLSTLSDTAKVDCSQFVEERAWLREFVVKCADGRELHHLFNSECAVADGGLQRINQSCRLPFSQMAMMMCVDGYREFCQSSVNMDMVVSRTEMEIRRLMFLDWHSQQAIETLSERIERNLTDALRVVFDGADEMWLRVEQQMKELMHSVAAMIHRLRQAAFLNPRKASKVERESWTIDYERKLRQTVEILRGDYREAWLCYRETMDAEDALELIRDRMMKQSPNNILIDENHDHRRSAGYMSMFISENRERMTGEMVDEYMHWEAGWVLLEEFRNTESQKDRNTENSYEDSDLVLRAGSRIIYANDVNITTAQGCQIIDKQVIGK